MLHGCLDHEIIQHFTLYKPFLASKQRKEEKERSIFIYHNPLLPSSMEDREEDIKVSILSTLFFARSIGGSVIFFLYIFLPNSQSTLWYSIMGLVLVSIPQLFWFLFYFYRCFKTSNVEFKGHNHSHSKDVETPKPKVLNCNCDYTTFNKITEKYNRCHPSWCHIVIAGWITTVILWPIL